MGIFSRKKNKEKNLFEESFVKHDNTTEDEEEFAKAIFEKNQLRNNEQKLAYVEGCCDQMVSFSKQIEEAKKELSVVEKQIEDVEKIENLRGPIKENLEKQVNRILNLKKDKTSYKKYTSQIPDKMYEFINTHEEEMPEILKNMKDNEDECQAIKTDLHMIDGEKSSLKYDRKSYQRKLKLVRRLLIITLCTVVIVTGILLADIYVKGSDHRIFMYLTIMIGLILIALVLVINQIVASRLMLTERKIGKAIGMTNKYKLRYVNSKASLDYIYSVYEVHNAYELSNMWQLYINAKKEKEAYFKMSEKLYKAVEEFTNIINKLRLHDPSLWNYQLGAIIDDKEMRDMKDKLEKRKNQLVKIIESNEEHMEKQKSKVKRVLERDPSIAKEVMDIIDKKEKDILDL